MTPDRARQERDRADKLLYAYQALDKATAQLDLVNKLVKSGQVWEPKFKLHDGGYYGTDITITVQIPAGIIQQQAVDAWKAARREVVLLGGELS